MEDSFNREREQQMIDALGQQQENPPNVFENNHSQSSSNYDDAAATMNNHDQQQRLNDIQQLNQLIQDQNNMLLSGTFNARSNPLNNLQIAGDGEEEHAKIFSNQTMEDDRSPANNIFSPEKQEHRRRTSEDEDEEADAEQLKRIERILKDQRKQ